MERIWPCVARPYTHSEWFLKYSFMSQWGKQLDWNISNEYHFELLAHSFHAYASADPITCFPILVNPFQSVLPFYTFDMLSVFRIRTPESILLLSSSASCSSMVSFAILRLFNYTMFTLRGTLQGSYTTWQKFPIYFLWNIILCRTCSYIDNL